jgi:hypothetical protein
MAKRKLTQIAKDFGISFTEAQQIVYQHLEESMVTGKGKNTWISENGQIIFDDFVTMPIYHRGQVKRAAPNPNFVYVFLKEQAIVVPVRKMGRSSNKSLVGKFIYFQQADKSENTTYTQIKPPNG